MCQGRNILKGLRMADNSRFCLKRFQFGGAFFAGLLIYGAAHASVFLEDKTWTELQQDVAAGTRTIIIPIGGTEQNGPAMALGKHNFRVRALAEKIATKLGRTMVAPVVAYVPEGSISPPQAHMKFPGTITVPDKVFIDLLSSAASSFKHAGFQTIVLIGDHGSYQGDLTAVATSLNREWKGAAFVFDDRNYYDISQNQYVEALKAHGVAEAEIGTHAALADTSLMMAIDASKVRSDIIASKQKLDASVGIYNGNPKHASAQLGQLGIDLIVNGTVEAIQKFNETHQVK
jgi:creatinine amidohydrolase